MHTFFLREIAAVGETVRLDKRDEKHLFKTLRARVGEEIALIDGAGVTACAQVGTNETLHIIQRQCAPEPELKIYIAVATPRRAKMEQLLTQCAELGVWAITPLLTARGIAFPDKDPDDPRRNALLIEACKQARNAYAPKLCEALSLADFLQSPDFLNAAAFFGDPYAQGVPAHVTAKNLCWIVGPEGGFTDQENELLRNSGAQGISLCPCILRVETAVCAGATALRLLAGC